MFRKACLIKKNDYICKGKRNYLIYKIKRYE